MRRIYIPRVGPPEVLELREEPDPTPHEGEVRIRVEAAGVNFADLMARAGMYPDAPRLPAVVGYEVAGTIDAVGAGVDSTRLGQDVVAITAFGGYSTHVVVPSGMAFLRPKGMDASTAAAIPVVGLTAWMLTREMFRVRAGDRVLVHSAGGGVGLAVLDLLQWRGARAFGVASVSKHEFLLARGYERVVDGRREDFESAFRAELREDHPFNLVLDSSGGASIEKSFRLIAPGGALLCYGFTSALPTQNRSLWAALKTFWSVPWFKFNPLALTSVNRAVGGVNMGRLFDQAEKMSAWMRSLLELASSGVLRPYIHAKVPLDNASEAHRILHARENLGKVLLIP